LPNPNNFDASSIKMLRESGILNPNATLSELMKVSEDVAKNLGDVAHEDTFIHEHFMYKHNDLNPQDLKPIDVRPLDRPEI
jgi:hypothetical protein